MIHANRLAPRTRSRWIDLALGRALRDRPVHPPVAPRRRLQIAVALALLAGLRTALVDWVRTNPRDFEQVWYASRAMLHGLDPYQLVGPGRPFEMEYRLFYPLTAAVAVIPLAPLPASVANVVFSVLGGGCFAWALMQWGYPPLVGFMGAGMVYAAEVVQWSPLFAASVVLPVAGLLFAAKPTIGAAMFVARPSWWPFIGGAVLLLIAFAAQPDWLMRWRDVLALRPPAPGAAAPYLLPIREPWGALILLTLLRWRRWEARMVLAMACVPQSMFLYETVPLFLVPRTVPEAGALVVLGYACAVYVGAVMHGSAEQPYYLIESAKAITVWMYLPVTAMILLRPNVADA